MVAFLCMALTTVSNSSNAPITWDIDAVREAIAKRGMQARRIVEF